MKRMLVAALALSLLLCACAGEPPPPLPSLPEVVRQPEPSLPEAEVEAKPSLTWAQGADATTLDPHNGSLPDWQVTCNLFDTLVVVAEDGVLRPSLASRWETEDGVAWRVTLRRNVRFHDGSPLTAGDVVFSLKRAAAFPAAALVEEVKAVGDSVVEITLLEPYAPLPAALSHPGAAILPQTLVEGDAAFFTHPVGTGPYRFAERAAGEFLRLSANEAYFGGVPKTQTLIMRVIPDPDLRTKALEDGEIDLAYDVAPAAAARVSANKGLKLLVTPSMTTWCLVFQTDKLPFGDPLIRRAIRYAIDEDALLKVARQGVGEAASSLIAPGAFGYIPAKKDPYDPERARALLAEAGYPFGFECSLWVNENPEREAACEAIKEQLALVGIEVTVRVLDYGSFLHRTSEGEHELAYLGGTAALPDADGFYHALVRSRQEGATGNRAFFKSDEVDRLIRAARETPDEGRRLEAYRELEALLREESPYAPLFYGAVTVGAAADLEGFVPNPFGHHRHLTTYRPAS